MNKIKEERKNQIELELENINGEYMEVDYDFGNGESIYFRSIVKIIEYVEWELENNSYTWQKRTERDKEDMVRLLSEYMILDNFTK